MNKAYTRVNGENGWQDYPSTDTPLNKPNLDKVDVGLNEVDNRVIMLGETKASKIEVSTLFKEVDFDGQTGIMTFTRKNGATVTIDTPMEKIQTGIYYNPDTEKLVLPLIDGTSMEVDLSRLMKFDEFIDSDTIAFSVKSNGTVTAIVKEGSIEEKHLRPNYLADIKVEATKAQSSATNAATSAANAASSAEEAESYAHGGTGTRENEDADNAMEYARQAKASAEQANDIITQNVVLQSEKGVAGGVATLGSDGKVPESQLPNNAGTINYNELENKPKVNGVILQGNKTLENLGGASVVRLTQEEYEALPNSKLTDGKLYLTDDGSELEEQGYTEASENVYYNNGNSGITSDNVQGAIDELGTGLGALELLGEVYISGDFTTPEISQYKLIIAEIYNKSNKYVYASTIFPAVDMLKDVVGGFVAYQNMSASVVWDTVTSCHAIVVAGGSDYGIRMYGIR